MNIMQIRGERRGRLAVRHALRCRDWGLRDRKSMGHGTFTAPRSGGKRHAVNEQGWAGLWRSDADAGADPVTITPPRPPSPDCC